MSEITLFKLIQSRPKYDFVFISAIPSFYKINLFNELNKQCRILVIFLGLNSVDRTKDFVNGNILFDNIFLSKKDLELRNKLNTSLRLPLILFFVNFKYIGVGSWSWPESWIAIFLSKQTKNLLTLESSIFESKLKGYLLFLKKIFVKRLKFALVSGEPHVRLMRKLGFTAECIVTGGVGLTHRQDFIVQANKIFQGKFLYVGRLSPEKNLKFLINAFSHEKLSNFKLSIIGSGLLGDNLRSIAPHNVTFTEHLSHEKIHQAYIEHDVFILPSYSEPWGLVVEEALYYGLPVISSAKVGCVEDLILHYKAGEVFDPYSMASLIDAILNISREYGKFVASVNKIDFLKRDYLQIQSYTSILAKVSEL